MIKPFYGSNFPDPLPENNDNDTVSTIIGLVISIVLFILGVIFKIL